MAGLGGLLGMAGGYVVGGPAGAMIGGALGGAIDGNQETNGGAGASSQTRDPWGPAQPYMLRNLQTNADLQKFYQQHPFNETQQAGYQNQNGLIDKFNGQAAPGLLGFANQMMGSHYQRARGGAPGSVGYSRPTPQPAQQPQNGLLAGPFSAPQYQPLGKIDFNAQNPFSDLNLGNPANKAAIQTQRPILTRLRTWLQTPTFATDGAIARINITSCTAKAKAANSHQRYKHGTT